MLARKDFFETNNAFVLSFLQSLVVQVGNVEVSISLVLRVTKLIQSVLDWIPGWLWLQGVQGLMLLS